MVTTTTLHQISRVFHMLLCQWPPTESLMHSAFGTEACCYTNPQEPGTIQTAAHQTTQKSTKIIRSRYLGAKISARNHDILVRNHLENKDKTFGWHDFNIIANIRYYLRIQRWLTTVKHGGRQKALVPVSTLQRAAFHCSTHQLFHIIILPAAFLNHEYNG